MEGAVWITLIIDIAVEYGYETHTGFLKAFKRYFGSTPEKYRYLLTIKYYGVYFNIYK